MRLQRRDQRQLEGLAIASIVFLLALFAGSTAMAQDGSADDEMNADSPVTGSETTASTDGEAGAESAARVGGSEDPFVSGGGSGDEPSLFEESSSDDDNQRDSETERLEGSGDPVEPAGAAASTDAERADEHETSEREADGELDSSLDPVTEARELGVASSGRDGGSVDESSLDAEDVRTDEFETDGPRVDLGADTERKLVERSVRSNRDEIQSCYAEAVDERPEVAGVVRVEFVVEPDGSVGSARVVESTVNYEPLADCVKAELADSRYPRPKSGAPTSWTFPFKFE